jgi:hypothetical protein
VKFWKKFVLTAIPAAAVVIAAWIQYRPQPKPPVIETNDATAVIAGTILDENGNGLSGAEITLSGRNESYSSETSGNFRIVLKKKPAEADVRMLVSKKGFITQDRGVTPPVENLIIRLVKNP